MRTNRIKSRTGISLVLGLALAGLWLGSMLLLTRLGAEYWYEKAYATQQEETQQIEYRGRLSELVSGEYFLESVKTNPGLYQYWMLESMRYNTGIYPLYSDSLMTDGHRYFDTATVYLDKNGEVLVGGSDYIWFTYMPGDEWEATPSTDALYRLHGWVDLGTDKDTWPLLRNLYAGTNSLYDLRMLKLTGRFGEHGQFIPAAAWYVSDSMAQDGRDRKGASETTVDSDGTVNRYYYYDVRELVLEGYLEWQPLYDSGETGDDLVTIYCEHPHMYVTPETAPLGAGGSLYDFLLGDVRTAWITDRGYSNISVDKTLRELVIVRYRSYHDMTGYDVTDPGRTLPDPAFAVLTVTRSNPLKLAVTSLRWIYLWSALATLCLFFALRAKLQQRLIAPLEALAEAFEKKYEYLPPKNYGWQEPDAVYRGLSAMADTKRGQTNEIRRLKTALDYAKTAEEKRRHTTSALAHELKTPLAVVHSYAEGLQLGIAGEKTGFYLDTIVRESEKMDALVMEMLDFSRLESGRVQIARDRVELGALTKGIFDKLLPLAAEKNLTVTLDWESEFHVTADEARIAQAVQNFASNAVKYTPEGGQITVALRKDRKEARLSVWNSLDAPLPEEVLTQVWEPFFRADESRTARGTGLGLAITKQIVTLHGGSVSARNMNNGIQFTMTLPV